MPRFKLSILAVLVFGISTFVQGQIIFNETFNNGFGTFTAGAGTPTGAVWEHSSTGTAGSNGARNYQCAVLGNKKPNSFTDGI